MATSTSVNRPTNVQMKEKDVNNKLQLYGIYSAFANGKAPSNKQIDVALNSTLASKPLTSPSKKLSPEGQKLVGDLHEVIEQAKILLLTKNEGNLLQDFIWQTQQMTTESAQKPGAPVDKETAKQHGNEALEGLRALGTLILSNGQFRKLLSDALILLRSMAGDAATNTATRVNPTEEQLAQIDHPAEDNTWHDVPDLSKDNIKGQLKCRYNQNKPFSRSDVQKAAGDATEAAHPTGSRDQADTAALAAQDQREGTASGVDAESGARAGYDNLRAQASENVPQEAKDRTRKIVDSTKNYMSDKMPKERREQTIYRLKKMVVEIQGHQDYQRAIETLLRLAEGYTGHSKNIANQGTGAVKGAQADDNLQMAEADLKTLIERFANSTSMDDLFDSINTIYRDANRDPELKGFFKKMDAYIRKCLKEQGFIMQEQATQEWNQLYDQGHFLLRERYRNHTDRILDEFKFFGKQFDEDPQNKAFGEAMQKLFLDLGNDENGKPTFKPHLLKDLSEVIIPGIFESVRYVPIPRIEYSDPMMDAIVENLVIESDNLMPNVAEFSSDNYFRWGRKKIANKNKNKVMLAVSGIQMDIRDVSYYVKKKSGFPSITDKGVCNIFMGGDGFSFKAAMETADKNGKAHFFKVNSVTVNVKNLKIKMKQSNHKLLFNVFRPLLFKVVRPAIRKVLEKQIKDSIQQLDALVFSIHQEAKRAEADLKRNPDPENAQNIYQRYWTAAQKQFTQGKQKGQEKTEDKKVNMAVTQHDSIFQNISLPGGISSKATEFKELAAKGDKWESPVFSIGSAGETRSLPKVAAVSRKPHNVNTGGVRGGNAPMANTNTSDDYGQASGTGYDGANGGTTNGATSGFSNQVDQAFGGNNGGVKAINSNTSGTHTTLGQNNPVLTGSV